MFSLQWEREERQGAIMKKLNILFNNNVATVAIGEFGFTVNGVNVTPRRENAYDTEWGDTIRFVEPMEVDESETILDEWEYELAISLADSLYDHRTGWLLH